MIRHVPFRTQHYGVQGDIAPCNDHEEWTRLSRGSNVQGEDGPQNKCQRRADDQYAQMYLLASVKAQSAIRTLLRAQSALRTLPGAQSAEVFLRFLPGLRTPGSLLLAGSVTLCQL